MKKTSRTSRAVAAVILILLLPVITDVATDTLPPGVDRYRWLAWPLAVLLLLTLGLIERRDRARHGKDPQDPRTDPSGTSTPPIRRDLPRDTSSFVGREREIATLRGWLLLRRGHSRRSGGAVVVIHGMAGVGKTALAVHVGHAVKSRYPDGCYFLDLAGYAAGVAPTEPPQVLETLLRAMGQRCCWNAPAAAHCSAALAAGWLHWNPAEQGRAAAAPSSNTVSMWASSSRCRPPSATGRPPARRPTTMSTTVNSSPVTHS